MVQETLYFKTKDGRHVEIRSPKPEEAQAVLDAMAEIAASSPYILSTPESFKSKTLENQIKWVTENNDSESAIAIAVYSQGKIIGFCNGRSYADIKRKHRASLGVSLHVDYRGCGIGKKLMEVLLSKMKRFPGIKIIELDVMTNNKAAVKMYDGLGFKKGGHLPKAYILPDGEVSDNFMMYMEVCVEH